MAGTAAPFVMLGALLVTAAGLGVRGGRRDGKAGAAPARDGEPGAAPAAVPAPRPRRRPTDRNRA
ncbi:hypothetical protein ACFC5Z_09240 [Streptomyces sp. NPDC056004]|uniref:hypothetical protein n=1 Tax=unclassified Streptomyces TaxID=2593676 RepID=UPI0035DE652C